METVNPGNGRTPENYTVLNSKQLKGRFTVPSPDGSPTAHPVSWRLKARDGETWQEVLSGTTAAGELLEADLGSQKATVFRLEAETKATNHYKKEYNTKVTQNYLVVTPQDNALQAPVEWDIVGHIRPDLRSVSNFILGLVPELREVMFAVNPFTNGMGGGRSSLVGMRQAFQHIKNGGCLAIFPAGAVATYQPQKERTATDPGIIEDCKWPESIVKFIRMAECPVLPVYFEGTCSKHFHRVGKIDARLRTANLVNEVLNKKGMTIPMRIGKPITVAEMNNYESLDDLYGYLRNRIYAMQTEFEPKRRLIPRRKVKTRAEQIALPRDRKSLQRELERIKDKMLFQVSSYQCYLADYNDIPNCIIGSDRHAQQGQTHFRGGGRHQLPG